MTPQPHCDHECVCPAISGIMRSRKDVCEVYGCPNDTRSRPHNPAPQENQILVTFKNKLIVDYILLVSRRKGYDLGDYIEGNFEWDDMLPCIYKINPDDCQFCDFREQCPDRVGEPE